MPMVVAELSVENKIRENYFTVISHNITGVLFE